MGCCVSRQIYKVITQTRSAVAWSLYQVILQFPDKLSQTGRSVFRSVWQEQTSGFCCYKLPMGIKVYHTSFMEWLQCIQMIWFVLTIVKHLLHSELLSCFSKRQWSRLNPASTLWLMRRTATFRAMNTLLKNTTWSPPLFICLLTDAASSLPLSSTPQGVMTNSWGGWLFSSPNGNGDVQTVCYYLLCLWSALWYLTTHSPTVSHTHTLCCSAVPYRITWLNGAPWRAHSISGSNRGTEKFFLRGGTVW